MKYTDQYFEDFEKLPVESLKIQDVGFFIQIMQKNNSEHIDDLYNHFLTESWVSKAIKKRCEAFNIQIDKIAQILILYISDGIIGHAVTYIHYLEYWMNKKNEPSISSEMLIKTVFGSGFPSIQSINLLNRSQLCK